MFKGSIRFGLLLVGLPLAVKAQSSQGDALKLLNEINTRYQTSTNFHVEMIHETRATSDLQTQWAKEVVSAYEAPGNRYRFEGKSSTGSALVVSDGTTEWDLRQVYGEYAKRSAGSYTHPVQTDSNNHFEQSDTSVAHNAVLMRDPLQWIGSDALKSARFLADETIQISGRTIPCFVITGGSVDPSADLRTVGTHAIGQDLDQQGG